MRHAAAWFRDCLQRAAAAAPEMRHEAVLVFNCLHEKDTLGLLLPLSTLPFAAAFVTSVAMTRPTLTPQPRVDAVLEGFLEKKRALGDVEAVADLEAAGAAGGGAAAAAAAEAPESTWQERLQVLWGAAHSDPRLQVLRARVAQPVAEYGEQGGGGSNWRPQSPLPMGAPPTAILAGAEAALAAIRARAAEAGGGDASPRACHGKFVPCGGGVGACGGSPLGATVRELNFSHKSSHGAHFCLPVFCFTAKPFPCTLGLQ